MAAFSYYRGHPMWFDETTQDWKYKMELGIIYEETEEVFYIVDMDNKFF